MQKSFSRIYNGTKCEDGPNALRYRYDGAKVEVNFHDPKHFSVKIEHFDPNFKHEDSHEIVPIRQFVESTRGRFIYSYAQIAALDSRSMEYLKYSDDAGRHHVLVYSTISHTFNYPDFLLGTEDDQGWWHYKVIKAREAYLIIKRYADINHVLYSKFVKQGIQK